MQGESAGPSAKARHCYANTRHGAYTRTNSLNMRYFDVTQSTYFVFDAIAKANGLQTARTARQTLSRRWTPGRRGAGMEMTTAAASKRRERSGHGETARECVCENANL